MGGMTATLLQETQSREIDGLSFQVGVLPYAKALPAYHRIARMLAAPDDILASANIGMFLFASSFAEALTEADLKFFVELYGGVSQVSVSADKVLTLNNEANRSAVFSGRLETMFAWLDFATEVNFKAVSEKLRAARLSLEAQAEERAAKAQPKA
jgi:hypothetical protein